MVYGFDQIYLVHKSIELFFGKKIPPKLYTDSLSLFDFLATLNNTSEKHLLIDLSMLLESYDRQNIT